MIEAVFSFFHRQIKHVFWHTLQLTETSFGIRPKRFDTMDVGMACRPFVVTLMNPEVLGIADINPAVIGSPHICVDEAIEAYMAANHRS